MRASKRLCVATTSKHQEITLKLRSTTLDVSFLVIALTTSYKRFFRTFLISILAKWSLELSTRCSSFCLVNRFEFVEAMRTKCDERTCELICTNNIVTLSRLYILFWRDVSKRTRTSLSKRSCQSLLSCLYLFSLRTRTNCCVYRILFNVYTYVAKCTTCVDIVVKSIKSLNFLLKVVRPSSYAIKRRSCLFNAWFDVNNSICQERILASSRCAIRSLRAQRPRSRD